ASGGDGTGLDGSRLAKLLDIVAALADLPPGEGMPLGSRLAPTASGGPRHAEIALATTAPAGPIAAEIDARARIDESRRIDVSGRLAVTVPLPGAWPTLGIALAADADGFTLELSPAGADPIRL